MILALVVAVGGTAATSCQRSKPPVENGPQAAGDEGHHQHEAPHGGTLVELGEEFAHLELILEREAGRLTAFVLDGEAEAPIRLAQPTVLLRVDTPGFLAGRSLELLPVASALTGERAGDASEFALTDPLLKDLPLLTGVVRAIDVRGQVFRDVRFSVP